MRNKFFLVFALILTALKTAAQNGYSNLEFIENKGQWDKQVNFKANIGTGSFFIQKKGFTVLLHNTNDLMRLRRMHSRPVNKELSLASKNNKAKNPAEEISDSSQMLHSHAYRVSFLDANENVEIVPDKPLPTYNNYFIGNDPSKWAPHWQSRVTQIGHCR